MLRCFQCLSLASFCGIDVCTYFPYDLSYMLLPVGLKYLKTTVVAIYGYLILIVATIVSLILGQDRFSWTQTFAILLFVSGFIW